MSALVDFSGMRLDGRRGGRGAAFLRRTLTVLLWLVTLIVCARLWLPMPWLGRQGGWEALFLLLLAAVPLAGLGRSLPNQNLALISVVTLGISSGAWLICAKTGIPFGPISYSDRGLMIPGGLPWQVPFIWLAAVLASRGVARLLARPWRAAPNYGFRVIGLSLVLMLLLDFLFEPVATRVRFYWKWEPTRLALDWYGAPVSNFFGWLLLGALILAFITPALINKSPIKAQPDFSPLISWAAANLFLLCGLAAQHLWLAMGVGLLLNLGVVVFLLAGGRNPKGPEGTPGGG